MTNLLGSELADHTDKLLHCQTTSQGARACMGTLRYCVVPAYVNRQLLVSPTCSTPQLQSCQGTVSSSTAAVCCWYRRDFQNCEDANNCTAVVICMQAQPNCKMCGCHKGRMGQLQTAPFHATCSSPHLVLSYLRKQHCQRKEDVGNHTSRNDQRPLWYAAILQQIGIV